MSGKYEDAFIIISVTIPVNCQKLIDCPIFFKVVNHLLASCSKNKKNEVFLFLYYNVLCNADVRVVVSFCNS